MRSTILTAILGLLAGGSAALPFLSGDNPVHADACSCTDDVVCTDVAYSVDTVDHAACTSYSRPDYAQVRITRDDGSPCSKIRMLVSAVTPGICGLSTLCDPTPEEIFKCWNGTGSTDFHLHAFWFKVTNNSVQQTAVVEVWRPIAETVCITDDFSTQVGHTICTSDLSCSSTTTCSG